MYEQYRLKQLRKVYSRQGWVLMVYYAIMNTAVLLLACVFQDPEIGSIFILTGSSLYFFSGSAPGAYAIALLTVIGVLFSILRHCYLHVGFGSTLLCAGIAMVLYEAAVFAAGSFLGYTTLSRGPEHLICALLGLVPNCAVSVLLTKFYMAGYISAGAMLAGLLPGAGVGLAVFVRMHKSIKERLLVLGALVGCGVLFGLLAELPPFSLLL